MLSRKEYLQAKQELMGEEKNQIDKIVRSYFNKSDLAKQIWNVQPFFFDDSKLWWLWNNDLKFWKIVDDINILVMVNEISLSATASKASKRLSTRSVRQSLASSTAAKVKLPG